MSLCVCACLASSTLSVDEILGKLSVKFIFYDTKVRDAKPERYLRYGRGQWRDEECKVGKRME